MDTLTNDRRAFIRRAGTVAATALLAGPLVRRALGGEHEHAGHGALGRGAADGYVMDASVTKHCATCEFWGGPRRLSADRKSITVTGFGWCNNPASPNHQKLTSPEHGPMDVWKKWALLE